MGHFRDLRRRSFLLRSLAFPFLRRLSAQETPLVDAEFHLHPRYRAQTALDATLLKIKPGLDDFITEKFHDQIAAILTEWRADLVNSVAKALAPDFLGASPQPAESRIVRPGPALEVRHVTFPQQLTLGPDAFVPELRSSLASFSTIHTAEFQITRIDPQPGNALRTRVRYELAGTGPGFHREQRVGWWDLEWEPVPPDQYRLRRWQFSEETRSTSAKPWFEDIAPSAFERAPSYSEQMLRGVDHWRTVLDGASGIDIYGHNGDLGRRYRWRRLRRCLRLPARRPSQSALSQPRRRNLRGHHRILRRRAARKHRLRDLRRLR